LIPPTTANINSDGPWNDNKLFFFFRFFFFQGIVLQPFFVR
jgi:hypothetical protein